MIKGDPSEDGFEHEFLYWCPECHRIEDVELCNPICQICGTEFVDIDKNIYPIIHALEKQHTIKSLQSCEGHFKEYEPGVYGWTIPYISFSVNPDAKISDIFNGKFPMLSIVNLRPDITSCIEEENDESLWAYRILCKQMDNYQFNMNWCIYMDDRDIPTTKDPDSHINSKGLWDRSKKRFLEQLLDWARSLK